MRILHYSHSDLGKPVASTEHVMQLAEHWAEAGHRVTVVVPAKGRLARWSRCQFEYVPFLDRRGFREATFEVSALVRLLWLVCRDGADVLYWRRHGLDPVPPLVHLLTGIPVVTEINGLRRMYEAERGLRHFAFWDAIAFRPLEWLVLWASRTIMPLSETQRRGIAAEYPRLAGRCVLQPTGLDYSRFRPIDAAGARVRLGLRVECLPVVWVGYFFPWSGLETLVDAAPRILEEFPHARFVLLGDGHHRPEIERRVRERGLERAFAFPGFVEKDQLAEWYGAAAACVAPYRRDRLQAEGFPPYKVLEALACGRPVVATRGRGMIGWIEEEGLGALVEPEDAGALGEALAAVLRDPEQARAQGARAAAVMRARVPAWSDAARTVLEAFPRERRGASAESAAAGAPGRAVRAAWSGRGRAAAGAPRVTVIIPALDASREATLTELLAQLERQSFRDFEVDVVRGENRQGRAINRAAARAQGEILVTLDDDTQLGGDGVLEALVSVLDAHADVGLVGASTLCPPGASWFQRRAHREIPRREFPVADRVIDSDMVQHPCLAIRRRLFLEVGGEDEDLIRGLDPLLREKVRRAGYRVVIAPGTWIHHLLPPTLAAVLRMYWRNGRGSAFARLRFPERILELGSGFEGDEFARTRPFAFRVARRAWRTVEALLRGQWIGAATSCAYAAGYVAETLRGRQGP